MDDERTWTLAAVAEILDMPKRRVGYLVSLLVSAPVRYGRTRYREDEIRAVAICAAFQRDLGISAAEAVEYWHALMPAGGWCTGDDRITFSLNGVPHVRVSPGSIASRISRRILALEITENEALRLADAGLSSASCGGNGSRALVPLVRQTQRFVKIPANVFHPARLKRASTVKETA